MYGRRRELNTGAPFLFRRFGADEAAERTVLLLMFAGHAYPIRGEVKSYTNRVLSKKKAAIQARERVRSNPLSTPTFTGSMSPRPGSVSFGVSRIIGLLRKRGSFTSKRNGSRPRQPLPM